MKLRGSTIFSLFLLVIVLVFVIVSLGYTLNARFGPLAVGIPAAILLITVIVQDMKGTKIERAHENDPPPRSYIIVTAWIAGLLIGTYLFGILVTFPLFTLAYIKAKGWRWLLSISIAAGVFVVLYGVFGLAFRVPLYKGIFLQYLL